MGKNVRVFTQLKQMPIRYALFFISDHIKQNLYAFYNGQAADKIKKKNMMGWAVVRKRCMNPILDNQIQWIDK
jgi:hypothetical protein